MKNISLIISCLLISLLLSFVALVNSSVTVAKLWNADPDKSALDSWTVGPDNNVYYLSANLNDPTIYKIDTTTNTKVIVKIMYGITSEYYWEGISYYDGYFYFATAMTIYRLNFNNPSSNHEVFRAFPPERSTTIHQINIDKTTGRMAIGFTDGNDKTLIYDFNTNSMLGITLPFGNVVFHPLTHDLFMVTGYNLVKYVVSGNSYSTTPQVVKNLGSYLASYWSVAIRNEKFFYSAEYSYYMYDFTTNQITKLATVEALESGIIASNGKIYIGGGSGVYVITLSADCSSLNNCNGQGTCIADGVCMCNPGWAGNSQCSAHSCEAVNNCGGHGTCSKPNTCVCTDGWSGNSCQTAPVTGPDCSALNNCGGHGTCTGNNQCTCNSGWKGNAECSLPSCDGVNDCGGKGTCSGPNTCSCVSGWTGNAQCSQYSCEGVNNCNNNGVCSGANTCTCNSGWNGDAQCSQYSCEAVNHCAGNGNCVGPNTCSGIQGPTCQTGWKSNTFGAPKPIITPSYDSASKKFILNVEMFKNDLPQQNTFNSLTLSKTNNVDSSNCQTSESNNSPFVVINDGECSKKYEYLFGTAELGPSNGFVSTVSNDGNSLIYSSLVTTSYSSNDINTNTCSLYQFTTKVQYQLSLVASQTEFTSVDNIAKFIVKRIHINNEKKFVLEGKLSKAFDKVSSFQDITLAKQNAPALTLSQSSLTSCGSACYNLIFTSDQIASESLDDTYKLQFKMSELPSDSNNVPVENTRTLSIDIVIQYTVPVDPSVISGNEITSSITLYNSNDALPRPLISYSTSDKVFLGNAINDANIVLPTNTKFSPLNAKVCCVPSATAFPSTGCSGTGHTASADLIVNKVAQQNVDVAIEGQNLNSKTALSKEYLLQFLIKDKLSNIPTSAQTCRIYIESTFQTPLNARSIKGNQLLSNIVKSQSQFSIVQGDSTETEETIDFSNVVTNSYYSIVVSSAIVGSGLLLSVVIVALAIGCIYYQKKKNINSVCV